MKVEASMAICRVFPQSILILKPLLLENCAILGFELAQELRAWIERGAFYPQKRLCQQINRVRQ